MVILETNEVGTTMFAKGRVGHPPMAQAVWPCQLLAASENTDEEYRFRVAEIQWSKRPSL